MTHCPIVAAATVLTRKGGGGMANIEVLDFGDAIERSSAYSKRHVLLGNGFSIACRPDRFTYGSLLDEATFDGGSPWLRDLFSLVGTVDFEEVIRLLELAAKLCEIYAVSDPGLADEFLADAEVVREALAQVLAARHPDFPHDIHPTEYQAARQFLSHFERIYTVNYDMLLYWTVMQDMEPRPSRDDGFGNPDYPDAPYVVWKPYATFGSQRLFYLHGSLHLYDQGFELAKITWSRTSIPLLDQIREALAERRYPLIVTEGSSTQKVTRILHSAYLNHAIRSFSGIQGALFVYGLSLADNDEHLLRLVRDGKLSALYVSLYGDPNNDTNSQIAAQAFALAADRPANRPLKVHFYDAASAHVWG